MEVHYMNDIIVRLLSIELKGFKNVDFGKIDMPGFVSGKYNEGEILGIYGQNGSGKTAVIDAIGFLKKLMMGLPLPKDAADYIGMLSDKATCNFKFYIQNKINQLLV